MTERRRKQTIYVVLVLAVIYGLWNFTVGRRSTARVPSEPTSAPAAAATAPSNDSTNVQAITSKPWGRDPFRGTTLSPSPAGPTTTAGTGAERIFWILSGIVYNDTHPLAVINQSPVSVGDMIDGARVVKIERTKVTLEKSGSRFDLFVSKG